MILKVRFSLQVLVLSFNYHLWNASQLILMEWVSGGQIPYISAGDGAFLEFVEDKPLPGVKILEGNDRQTKK